MMSAFRQQLPALTGGFDQCIEFGIDSRTRHAFWLRRQVQSRPWQDTLSRRVTLWGSQADVNRGELLQDADLQPLWPELRLLLDDLPADQRS